MLIFGGAFKMKKTGIVYLIVGVVAIIGAAAAAYMVFTLADALSIINTADASQLPPGTDVESLRQTVSSLNTMILASSIWVISVFLAGIFCVQMGVRNLKAKTKAYAGR